MITALIATAASIAYLVTWRWSAVWWYHRLRPNSEPLECSNRGWSSSYHKHSKYCYTRESSLITSNKEAAVWAGLCGLAGPLTFIAWGIAWLGWRAIASGDRPRPGEMQAKIERLERELGQR